MGYLGGCCRNSEGTDLCTGEPTEHCVPGSPPNPPEAEPSSSDPRRAGIVLGEPHIVAGAALRSPRARRLPPSKCSLHLLHREPASTSATRVAAEPRGLLRRIASAHLDSSHSSWAGETGSPLESLKVSRDQATSYRAFRTTRYWLRVNSVRSLAASLKPLEAHRLQSPRRAPAKTMLRITVRPPA